MAEVAGSVKENLECFHCGQPCEDQPLWLADKSFCCFGCQTVFEILNENDLCEYYSLDKNPGIQLKAVSADTYTCLDEEEIRKKVVEFDSETFVRVTFFIPAIHCVSCIWLLENLQKLNKGILRSQVNFARKSVTIDFNPVNAMLSEVAALLGSVGYAPVINLEQDEKVNSSTSSKNLVLKLAIAGFCFGNVMLFSFPEYLGLDRSDEFLMRIFSWLNVLLSVPVFFYSGTDYFTSAINSFKHRRINIDVPIAVGLLALFFRSTYDIVTHTGPGYLDSFTGLVFFLLIGRWFQGKTYESLAFDRDFKSYFPLAVHTWHADTESWKPTVVFELKVGDRIRVRNLEIVPADAVLLVERAYIDYSFVTGESKPVCVKEGVMVYAGGRLIGQPVELVVQKKTSQSHLTSLWNNEVFKKEEESKYRKMIDKAAHHFTWVVLVLAIITAITWYVVDPTRVWLVVTAVLMVACPCALALAAPFTYGNMLRFFGKGGFYLKNADVIERLAAINSVVFDKTGTITNGSSSDIIFHGSMDDDEYRMVKLLTQASTHPLSTLIAKNLKAKAAGGIELYKELPGKGIEATVQGKVIKIGSALFTGYHEPLQDTSSKVFVSVNGVVKGFFSIGTSVRKEMSGLVKSLGDKCAALLSGDNESDKAKMQNLFPKETELHFNQSPHDKLHFIESLQLKNKKVLMLGDGLNDSGALKQSDVGIAVTDDTGVFTPACDGILQGNQLGKLDQFLKLSRSATTILKIGFGISFFYNVIALSFAVSGYLTPLVAAILMPISSVSVVGFSTLAVKVVASRKKIAL